MDMRGHRSQQIQRYGLSEELRWAMRIGTLDCYLRRWRTWEGTFFTAKFPPIIAAAKTGSVGVRHAEIASADTNVNEGNRAQISPDGQRGEGEGVISNQMRC